MILAAGRGERMRDLTENQPKPLIEIAGKPLIVYQIESLVLAGVEKIIINTGRFGEQIRDNLGSGENYSVKINYSDEGNLPLETAGGVVKALPLLGDSAFILTNADIFTDFDYRTLPSQLDSADAHLVLVNNPEHNLLGDFVLENGRVLETGRQKLTYSGIGYHHPKFFKKYISNKNCFPLAPLLYKSAKDKNLSGQHYIGYWNDVGTPERLEEIKDTYSISK
jgi:MurNAc alpha-1-phosphate uridylyltransferase